MKNILLNVTMTLTFDLRRQYQFRLSTSHNNPICLVWRQ